jgi:amphi-Trp domain-containing protein
MAVYRYLSPGKGDAGDLDQRAPWPGRLPRVGRLAGCGANQGGVTMSDVKVEYEQTMSRAEAAAWLSQLARAFAGDHDAEFSLGPGTVKLLVPGSVRAEVEVEVEDDEVEVEIEFTWPLHQRNAERASAVPSGAKAASSPRQRANGAGRLRHATRAARN